MYGWFLTLLLCQNQPHILQVRMLSGRTTMGQSLAFNLFCFLQTQQNNQATLPKQKDPSPPWKIQRAHFLGTFSATSAAQLFSASLQRRAHHVFAFWAEDYCLFPRNWVPSKVPALHPTFLQNSPLQVPERQLKVCLHQAPSAVAPWLLSTNHSHVHFLVCSH